MLLKESARRPEVVVVVLGWSRWDDGWETEGL